MLVLAMESRYCLHRHSTRFGEKDLCDCLSSPECMSLDGIVALKVNAFQILIKIMCRYNTLRLKKGAQSSRSN